MEQPGAVSVVRSRRMLLGDSVEPADLVVAGTHIVDVLGAGEADAVVAAHSVPGSLFDAGELLVAPGLVDTQINGAGPVDLRDDPAGLPALCAAAARCGVTSLVATLPSHDLDLDLVGGLQRSAAAMASVAEEVAVATVLGIHMEGPFLAPARAGAHRVEELRPVDADVVAAWARHPSVVMVTLAPELAGALDAIEVLAQAGVCVAIGHTDADLERFCAAVDAGARHVTHLWNAMAGLHHRAPGVIGAAMTDERVTGGLICDGAHVDPVVLRLTWCAMGPDRLVLVSDAIGSAPQDRDAVAVIGADGTLQGSTTMLDQGVRNLIASTGASVIDALTTATRNPALLLGRRDIGVLRSGARADVVVFDEDLVPLHVMIGGRWTPEFGAPVR